MRNVPEFGETPGCSEWERLYSLFVSALSTVIAIQIEQARSDCGSGSEAVRLNRLLYEAVIRQRAAKKALIRHLEAHQRCGSDETLVTRDGRIDTRRVN
ncbi:MAG TPA: hypothetical protein VGH38_25325 [Bryobacteraceae bacterium]